jgi:hypothetical protein
MLGRFAREGAEAAPDFALRCPVCDGGGQFVTGFSNRAAPMHAARVLDGVNGFRTGYNRIQAWWQAYVSSGLASGRAACVRCGGEAVVDTTAHAHDGNTFPGFVARCRSCPERFYVAPGGLVFHTAEFGEFWRAHPRLRYLPAREVVCEGQPAVVTGFADRQGSARLEIVFARSDLRRLRLLYTD